jgi:hypothetical protein
MLVHVDLEVADTKAARRVHNERKPVMVSLHGAIERCQCGRTVYRQKSTWTSGAAQPP